MQIINVTNKFNGVIINQEIDMSNYFYFIRFRVKMWQFCPEGAFLRKIYTNFDNRTAMHFLFIHWWIWIYVFECFSVIIK